MNSTISKLNAVVLGTLPVWYEYEAFRGTSVGSFFLLLLLPFSIFKLKDKSSYNEKLWFVAILIIGFIGFLFNQGSSWFDISIYVNNHWQLFLFFAPLILMVRNADVRVFIKTVIFVGALASLICIYQRIILFGTGSYPNNFFIPFLKLGRLPEEMTRFRPSAFFSEPSHITLFLLPIFYYSLKRRDYFLASLFGLGVLCSGSSTGLIGLPLIIIMALFSSGEKFSNILIVSIIIAAGAFVLVNYLPDVLLEGQSKMDMDNAENSTRLFLPFQYLSFFSGGDFIWGIGLGQLEKLLVSSGFWVVDTNLNFAPLFIYTVISYGIVGLIFFLVYFYRVWKKYSQERGFFYILIIIALASRLIFNNQFLYLLSFVLLSDKISLMINRTKSLKIC